MNSFLPKLGHISVQTYPLMATSFPCCFLFSILLFLPHITITTQACETRYCRNPARGPPIHYPFHLKSDNCGDDPKFEVFCDKRNQTLMTLKNAGEFVVKRISFEYRKVWINDPNHCLPSRFLHGIDFGGSPFNWSDDYDDFLNVEFQNCSAKLSDSIGFVHTIGCLSSDKDNYWVIAVLSDPSFPTSMSFPGCRHISSASLPVYSLGPRQPWANFYSDMQLQWNEPNCFFIMNSGPDRDTACYNNVQNPGNDDYKMYKLLGVGIAGAVCFCVAGLARLLGAKVEAANGVRRRRMNIELERNYTVESLDMRMGLDESTIEQYPKTQIGDSGRLPNSSDNICSICLSEYEPMETLRTIPHCNHYFHVDCIDGWLKRKGTCPLCRHLPDGPSLSLSSTTSHH